MPCFNKDKNRYETSVAQIRGFDEGQIWNYGRNVMAVEVKARADFVGSDAFEFGLDIDPDNVPERHAAIIGWPDLKAAKEDAKDIAGELALASNLRFPPEKR